MKEKILIFIIGILVGAVISTGAFYIYTRATNNSCDSSTNNTEMNGGERPEMPNGEFENSERPELPNGENGEPPEMPNGENGENNQKMQNGKTNKKGQTNNNNTQSNN